MQDWALAQDQASVLEMDWGLARGLASVPESAQAQAPGWVQAQDWVLGLVSVPAIWAVAQAMGTAEWVPRAHCCHPRHTRPMQHWLLPSWPHPDCAIGFAGQAQQIR